MDVVRQQRAGGLIWKKKERKRRGWMGTESRRAELISQLHKPAK